MNGMTGNEVELILQAHRDTHAKINQVASDITVLREFVEEKAKLVDKHEVGWQVGKWTGRGVGAAFMAWLGLRQ